MAMERVKEAVGRVFGTEVLSIPDLQDAYQEGGKAGLKEFLASQTLATINRPMAGDKTVLFCVLEDLARDVDAKKNQAVFLRASEDPGSLSMEDPATLLGMSYGLGPRLRSQGDQEASIAILSALLERGADTNLSSAGITPLGYACSTIKSPALVKLLLDGGAKPNLSNETGATPLMSACFAGPESREITELLLEHGADINRDSNEAANELKPWLLRREHANPDTAFALACGHAPKDTVELLWDRGARFSKGTIRAVMGRNDAELIKFSVRNLNAKGVAIAIDEAEGNAAKLELIGDVVRQESMSKARVGWMGAVARAILERDAPVRAGVLGSGFAAAVTYERGAGAGARAEAAAGGDGGFADAVERGAGFGPRA